MARDRQIEKGVQPVVAPSGTPQSPVTEPSSDADVAVFVNSVKALAPRSGGAARGRLVFAMDATMSRQPTWDMAVTLQAGMFDSVKAVGGLDVQLVFFRGFMECRSSEWVADPDALKRLMTSVSCRAGQTQIGRVLKHTRCETETKPVDALVYVGDCVEEDIDALGQIAGELGLLNVPVFAFQEGHNRQAERAMREIARLSKGAFSRFDAGSAGQLRALLEAVAIYAAGGRAALARLQSPARPEVAGLLEQLR